MFNEENLENLFMKLFEERGYEHILGTTIERDPRQILLTSDFQSYLKNRYPDLDEGELYYIQATFATLDQGDYVNNRQTFRKICNGIDMKRMQEGKKPLHVDFIDFQHPDNNIFKIINQYSIQGPKETRRPDALVFVNGIPLVIIEFKSATNENATLYNAYEQICERYVRDISDLFAYNAFCVISDGVNSRIGTHFSNYENFYSWNKANSKDAASEGIDYIEILMDGVFEKKRFLSIIKDFIYFPDDSGNNLKIVCRYPQYFGANALYENIRKHMKPEGDGKGGTYFGTTGCGKSYTMLFLSRLLMTSKEMKNPTIVVITDRNNLDIQLHSQFVKSKRFLMDDNIVSISSREDLKNKLSGCRSGGVYLTTIQKFSDGDEALSDRNNIIVISDEAHRSQLNLEDADKMVNGVRTHVTPFALMLHKALPNATYVGFTGTPIDNTLEVFGGIVDQYTMVESEKDKITSKLVYEGRAAKVVLDQSQMDAIEQYYADCEDMGANQYQIEKSKKDLAKMENIIGNETRLQKIAKDFVAHYEKRVYEGATVAGKALFVCSNRKIAYNFYLELKRIRPEWFTVKEADNTGLPDSDKAELIEMVKIVATRGMNDPKEMYDLLGDEQYRENLAVQFKKINSNFKIAIVVDMWLTGFDVPFLDAIYIDKPIQKHNLIQAISRVNRIYPGKEYGLIVDYLGIRKELDAALKKYTNGYRSEGLETSEEFLSVMREYLSIIDGIFFGFDMSDYNSDEEATVLKCLNRAVEFVQKDRDTEKRFMAAVRKLKVAYNNCTYEETITKAERDRIYFYSAVRSIITKVTSENVPDTAVMNAKVREMLERALQSDDVVQLIMTTEEMDEATIDLLSDEYLEKIKKIPGLNTKFKLLQRLTRLSIDSLKKVNKLKSDEFSEKFRALVTKYNDRHFRADDISKMVEDMLQLLIQSQKEKESGTELGLTFEEKSFYDILDKMTNDYHFEFDHDKLIAMSKELKVLTDKTCSVIDWISRSDIKDELRFNIVMTLKKYGFPPVYYDGVYQKVFEQLESYKRYSN